MATIEAREGASTRAPRRSDLARLTQPDAFLWATGIEDTFVFDRHHTTGRILDEYELTDHYNRWRQDLELMAQLRVPAARYGVPWYRISPEKGRWDWSFANQTLEKMLELGIDPIVDLVHYGTPGWMENGFLNPDYPKYVAEYSAFLAQKFKGRIHWYTPLNEPRITAWYCGRLGQWPPYQRGWSGFVRVMIALCKGIVLTDRALTHVDPEIVKCHVDATDLFSSEIHEYAEDVRFRQNLVFLALDLISGRVDETHPLMVWLLKHGAFPSDLQWFKEHALEMDVVGLNLYPMFTNKVGVPGAKGPRWRMTYGTGDLVEDLGRMYWERYRRPMMVTETASAGPLRKRAKWLDDSLEAVRRLRAGGIPMVGYTWWPMFSLIAWAYRSSERPIGNYVVPMGLWDLNDDLDRLPTELVGAYREAVTGGIGRVGRLEAPGGIK